MTVHPSSSSYRDDSQLSSLWGLQVASVLRHFCMRWQAPMNRCDRHSDSEAVRVVPSRLTRLSMKPGRLLVPPLPPLAGAAVS
jgi:hypothetical protein